MKNDRDYLEHMLEALHFLEEFTAAGKEAFLADRKTQSAVLRELQTLAESSQRLSDDLKKTCPEIYWEGVAGFRNVLVHDYLGINLHRVWEIIQNDLPQLSSAVRRLKDQTEKK